MTIPFEKASWMLMPDGAYLMLKCGRRDAADVCDSIEPGKPYEAEIRKEKKKRTLDANAYFWTLCGKLAAKTGTGKTDIYREMIREIGDNFEILPIRNEAVEKFRELWERNGTGWVCEVLGRSKITNYTNVIAYYGSSTYDTRQMSCLINLAVQECKGLGIETLTPEELSRLVDRWGP